MCNSSRHRHGEALEEHIRRGQCPNIDIMNPYHVLRATRRRHPACIRMKQRLACEGLPSRIAVTQATFNLITELYECYICFKGFKHLSGLNNHVRSGLHRKSWYMCPNGFCRKTFSRNPYGNTVGAIALFFEHLETEEVCGRVRFKGFSIQYNTAYCDERGSTTTT